MSALTAPAVMPFTLAALVMGVLVLVEAVSLFVGHSASGIVDAMLGHDGPHGLETAADSGHDLSPSAWMSWINFGRVPFLILLILGLALFALTGLLLQGLAGAVAAPLPAAIAAVLAAGATLPALRVASRVIGRIIPRDKTYVVSADDLIGSTAEVTLGPLDGGLPGQVRAVDRHGNAHFLRARAADTAVVMKTGEKVLLVDRQDGVFVAVPATPDL